VRNQHFEILKRFPDKKHILTQRMAEDPDFCSFCQDYELCVKTLQYWTSSNKPEAKARINEYRTLVQELEQEIACELKSSDSKLLD
jgi:hypothetical protein